MRPSVVPPGNPAEHPAAKPRFGYLTPKQAAEFVNLSKPELERLRRVGGGPKFCHVTSRTIRYPVEELCAWLDSFLVNNTSEAAERERLAAQGVARA